jgi:uncharacterized repeat protein (TIGR02543 family)
MKKAIGLLSIILVLSVVISCSKSSKESGGDSTINGKNVNLASLSISNTTLPFNSETSNYNVEFPANIDAISISAVAVDSTSIVTINETPAETPVSINLNYGLNYIVIKVSSSDGSVINNYIITATRINGVSHNSNLIGLNLSSGTLSPAFNSEITQYTTEVLFSISSLNITPLTQSSKSKVEINNILVDQSSSINISLNAGLNNISIKVTAEDGLISKTYQLVVNRVNLSSNANLASLNISFGTLNPIFDRNILNYSIVVNNTTTSITVTPLSSGAESTIMVNGLQVISGNASQVIDLGSGNNTITIIVTAQDGTIRTYLLTICRGITITYDGNGQTSGSMPVDSNNYLPGQTIVIMNNIGSLQRNNYKFNGWNTAANGSGINYTPGQSFTINSSNITLYAKWSTAQWAQSVSWSTDMSSITKVCIDNSGNIYAVGSSSGSMNFGNGITASFGAFLVKYNSAGVAQWATTVPEDTSNGLITFPYFNAVSVDNNSNIYVSGVMFGLGKLEFGNNITAYSKFNGNNVLLVKYNSSGIAQGAVTTVSGDGHSGYNSVCVDNGGNIYAAGFLINTETIDFGNNIKATGAYYSSIGGYNILLVKYNSNGVAQWAKTLISGSYDSNYNAVCVDSNGNIYTAGLLRETSEFNFGNSITRSSGSSGNNILFVKYNSSGDAQWARTIVSGQCDSRLLSVSFDGSGNVYAAGYIGNANPISLGNNVFLDGSANVSGFLIKYNSAGDAQWATKDFSSSNQSLFNSIKADSNGNIYAAGSINGTNPHDFGNSITISGAYVGSNILLVKYNSSGVAQWAHSTISGLKNSCYNAVDTDASGNIVAAGEICGTDPYDFGGGVTATGSFTESGPFAKNVVIVKYY